MPLFNTSLGGSTPKTLVTPDGVTDSIAIEKVDGKTVKPSSTLGNATADKVLQGYTFTSDGGFDIAGTSTAASDLEVAKGEITEATNQINSLSNTIANDNDRYDDLIKKSNSISNGSSGTSILNISGGGELHFIKLSGGGSSGSAISSCYLEITFDNEFTFYLPIGAINRDGSYEKAGGVFCLYRHIINYNSSNSYAYFCIGNERTTIYHIIEGRKTPWSYMTYSDWEIGCVMNDVCDNNVLNNSFNWVGSFKPLRFDSSLKIKAYNSSGSSCSSLIYYRLVD